GVGGVGSGLRAAGGAGPRDRVGPGGRAGGPACAGRPVGDGGARRWGDEPRPLLRPSGPPQREPAHDGTGALRVRPAAAPAADRRRHPGLPPGRGQRRRVPGLARPARRARLPPRALSYFSLAGAGSRAAWGFAGAGCEFASAAPFEPSPVPLAAAALPIPTARSSAA